MKSKKAEEYIEDNVHDAADLVDRDGCGWAVVGRHYAYHAIEFAEEDMAEKAIKAYIQCCNGCARSSRRTSSQKDTIIRKTGPSGRR